MEKLKLIRMVEESSLLVKRTLVVLDLPRSAFYRVISRKWLEMARTDEATRATASDEFMAGLNPTEILQALDFIRGLLRDSAIQEFHYMRLLD